MDKYLENEEVNLFIMDGIDYRLERLGEEALKGIVKKIDNHEDAETILKDYKINDIDANELCSILPMIITNRLCKYCKEKMIRRVGFDFTFCPHCGHEYVTNSSRLCECTNCNKERKYKTITRAYDEWKEWMPPVIGADTFEYNDFVKLYMDYQSSRFRNIQTSKTDKNVIVKMDLYLKEIENEESKYYTDLYHKGDGILKIQDMYEKDLIFDEKFQNIKSFKTNGGVITFGFSMPFEFAQKVQNHTIFVNENYYYDTRKSLMTLLSESGFEYAKKQAKKRGFEIEKTTEGMHLINSFLEEECYLIYITLVKKAVIYVSDDILLGKLDEEEASIEIFEKALWFLNYGRENNFKQYCGHPFMTSDLKKYLSICLGIEKKEILENRIEDILEIVKGEDNNCGKSDIKSILGLQKEL